MGETMTAIAKCAASFYRLLKQSRGRERRVSSCIKLKYIEMTYPTQPPDSKNVNLSDTAELTPEEEGKMMALLE